MKGLGAVATGIGALINKNKPDELDIVHKHYVSEFNKTPRTAVLHKGFTQTYELSMSHGGDFADALDTEMKGLMKDLPDDLNRMTQLPITGQSYDV